ncbi:hypothetical protein Aph02nite_55500 [Actinoplanes philippinensis]|uniref:Uncharacterized protein n=1 Tax=Actinoplanes philippinensis TaxID=35752 RepID=A0A1I2J8C5_9ACTN|nr:hypothetical protein [Actinoplanes philippinensis]GIE79600.1 hypothetical protein Aph02nite_55500 [Actinoplanes philippinensis]SFF48981.1 hypothetical protein SAMN05421541_111252 [Actinoplanes philippinensis]
MHRKQWWAAATAAVLAIAAGTVVYRSRLTNSPDGTTGCRLLSPPSSQSAEPTSGIRIIEAGHTVVGSNDPKVSMGVVLRNETERVAYRTLVTFDALDAAGRTVIADDDQPLRTQVIPLIGPGATVAVGNANLLRPGTESTIDSLAVTLRGASWLSRGDGSTGLGRVTATMTKGSGRRTIDGQGEVSFSADSENCADLKSRGVSLVFRDSSDRVIGGSLDNSPPLDVCATGHHDGQRAAMTQTDIPAEADLDRTLVTIHCDFDLPRPVLSSGAPYN